MTREPLLKTRDVAAMLGLEMGTVYDYWERGELPGFRLGGRKGGPLRFRQSEIEQRLETWRAGTVPGDNSDDPRDASSARGPGTREETPHAPTILRAVDG
jgi:predicted DNA-binding transcriptional regulator AlpA